MSTPEKAFKYSLAASVSVTVSAVVLALLGAMTQLFAERVVTSKDPKSVTHTGDLGVASFYVGFVLYGVLMLLLGYQGVKGPSAAGGSANAVKYSQYAACLATIGMSYALCGMGIKTYNDAITVDSGVKKTAAAGTDPATASAATEVSKTEDKTSKMYYNVYVAALVIMSAVLATGVGSVVNSTMVKNKVGVSGGGFAKAAAAPAAPSGLSDFFIY